MRPSEKQIPGTSSAIPPRCKPANSKLSSSVYCYLYQNIDHMRVFPQNYYASPPKLLKESVESKQTSACPEQKGLWSVPLGISFLFSFRFWFTVCSFAFVISPSNCCFQSSLTSKLCAKLLTLGPSCRFHSYLENDWSALAHQNAGIYLINALL